MQTNRPSTPECTPIGELLSAYLDGDLEVQARQRVEQHLASCFRCAEDLAGLRLTVQALRSLPALAPPRSFALPTERAPRPSKLFYFRLASGAFAAAFALAFVVTLALPTATHDLRSTSEPFIAQSPAAVGPAPRPALAPAAPRPAAGTAASPPPRAARSDEPTPLPAPAPKPAAAAPASAPRSGESAAPTPVARQVPPPPSGARLAPAQAPAAATPVAGTAAELGTRAEAPATMARAPAAGEPSPSAPFLSPVPRLREGSDGALANSMPATEARADQPEDGAPAPGQTPASPPASGPVPATVKQAGSTPPVETDIAPAARRDSGVRSGDEVLSTAGREMPAAAILSPLPVSPAPSFTFRSLLVPGALVFAATFVALWLLDRRRSGVRG